MLKELFGLHWLGEQNLLALIFVMNSLVGWVITEQSTGDYISAGETLVILVHEVLLRFWAISWDVGPDADFDRTT